MIDNGFVLIFCAVLTGMYIFGTIFDTRNKKEWSKIIFNDFFVFGFFGIVGLLYLLGICSYAHESLASTPQNFTKLSDRIFSTTTYSPDISAYYPSIQKATTLVTILTRKRC